jgi:hypothetical protein
MYRKNTASQSIYFALINASTGAALTGATVTARRALDATAQATATGTVFELGNGQYRFNLSQADTNANYGSYLFTAASAVPVEKTVVFTAANPTDGETFGISKLDLLVVGSVSYSGPVDPTGVIRSPIIRGDDYLAANARALTWTFSAITGMSAGTSTAQLGFKSGTSTLVATGTVTDNGDGTWTASFDLTKGQTAGLTAPQYDWSVEIVGAGGAEITQVRSGRSVIVADKFT